MTFCFRRTSRYSTFVYPGCGAGNRVEFGFPTILLRYQQMIFLLVSLAFTYRDQFVRKSEIDSVDFS